MIFRNIYPSHVSKLFFKKDKTIRMEKISLDVTFVHQSYVMVKLIIEVVIIVIIVVIIVVVIVVVIKVHPDYLNYIICDVKTYYNLFIN